MLGIDLGCAMTGSSPADRTCDRCGAPMAIVSAWFQMADGRSYVLCTSLCRNEECSTRTQRKLPRRVSRSRQARCTRCRRVLSSETGAPLRVTGNRHSRAVVREAGWHAMPSGEFVCGSCWAGDRSFRA